MQNLIIWHTDIFLVNSIFLYSLSLIFSWDISNPDNIWDSKCFSFVLVFLNPEYEITVRGEKSKQILFAGVVFYFVFGVCVCVCVCVCRECGQLLVWLHFFHILLANLWQSYDCLMFFENSVGYLKNSHLTHKLTHFFRSLKHINFIRAGIE